MEFPCDNVSIRGISHICIYSYTDKYSHRWEVQSIAYLPHREICPSVLKAISIRLKDLIAFLSYSLFTLHSTASAQ